MFLSIALLSVSCTSAFDKNGSGSMSLALSKYSNFAHYAESNDTITFTSQNKLNSQSLGIEFSCYYDLTVDNSVSTSLPCNNLNNFLFNTTNGDISWSPSNKQVGNYEFRVDVNASGESLSKIFNAKIILFPAFNIKNDSKYETGDNKPEIVFNDFLNSGDRVSFYTDSSCSEVILDTEVGEVPESYRKLETPALVEGNYSFYMQATVDNLKLPCINTHLTHKFKTPKRTVKIFSTDSEFIAQKEDGTAVAWGILGAIKDFLEENLGSSGVDVYYNTGAIAVLKTDGSVVTLGDDYYGGDTSSVDLSSGVQNIFNTDRAFAALKSDGSVVTWGSNGYGGDSSGVDLSSGIVDIISNDGAFAAIKSDGSVVTWGSSNHGGDSSGVDLSSGVQSVYSTAGFYGAFAALKTDGSVVTWGKSGYGADSSGVDFSGGVLKITSTLEAFAAIKNDGGVVTWGDSGSGGDSSGVDFSGGIQQIYSTGFAFAALKNNGSVVTWGSSSSGGDSSGVSANLSSNVQKIFSNYSSFAALKNDGSVVTWGSSSYGGDSSGVDLSSNVVKILNSRLDFVAIKSNGKSVLWGKSSRSLPESVINNHISGNIKAINGTINVIYNDGSAISYDIIQSHAPDLRASY